MVSAGMLEGEHDFLLKFYNSYINPVLHRFQDIARYWPKNEFCSHSTSTSGHRSECYPSNFVTVFGIKKNRMMGLPGSMGGA